eukprot:gene31168-53429_t
MVSLSMWKWVLFSVGGFNRAGLAGEKPVFISMLKYRFGGACLGWPICASLSATTARRVAIPETRMPQYDTHEIFNQATPFENVNLFACDTALREGLAREGGGH